MSQRWLGLLHLWLDVPDAVLGLLRAIDRLLILFLVTDQIRVVRLHLVIDNHGLDVREHVLALAEAAVLHLALLDALHAAIVLDEAVAGAMMVLLIAARLVVVVAHPGIVVGSSSGVMRARLDIVTLDSSSSSIAWGWLLS